MFCYGFIGSKLERSPGRIGKELWSLSMEFSSASLL